MKRLLQLVGLLLVAGIAVVVFRATRQESSSEQSQPTVKRSIPPQFLAMLVDPVDKAPVELMTDSDGQEWLVNRARGYRYPVKNGIPMMRLEDAEEFHG
ncbi:MAG: Trm112 family protein [Roseiflexaceae bacterium]